MIYGFKTERLKKTKGMALIEAKARKEKRLRIYRKAKGLMLNISPKKGIIINFNKKNKNKLIRIKELLRGNNR